DAEARDGIEQPLDAVLVELLRLDAVVVDLAVGTVARARLRAAAEELAQDEIADRRIRHGPLERPARELGREPTDRLAARVDEHLDVVRAQEPEELLDRVVAVAGG